MYFADRGAYAPDATCVATPLLSLHSHLCLPRLIFWNLTTVCLAVTGGGSVGESGSITRPPGFWAHYDTSLFMYLPLLLLLLNTRQCVFDKTVVIVLACISV